ncbi:MAG: hypothetical protein CXX80_12250 [Methanobacteriota archaeon]|nr:MAG: hypothetical protein CXX80_12250 [Euryarchaeota archaeon]
MSNLLTPVPEPDGTCHCCGHALAEIEETLLCELCRPWRHAFLSIRHHFEPWVTHILREARPAMAIVSNRQELQTKPLCDDDWARLFTELGIPHKRTNYSRPSLDEGIVDRLEWLNCEGRTIVMDDNYASAYPRSEVPTSRKPRSVMAKIHTSFGTLVVTWDGVSVAGEKILGGPVMTSMVKILRNTGRREILSYRSGLPVKPSATSMDSSIKRGCALISLRHR